MLGSGEGRGCREEGRGVMKGRAREVCNAERRACREEGGCYEDGESKQRGRDAMSVAWGELGGMRWRGVGTGRLFYYRLPSGGPRSPHNLSCNSHQVC